MGDGPFRRHPQLGPEEFFMASDLRARVLRSRDDALRWTQVT